MGILVQNGWRNKGIFAAIIIMLISLFVSRACLSITLILFIALTTIHSRFVEQTKKFLTTPILLSISLLFFIPFISGLWSADLQEWSKVLLVKAPLLALPIAFAGDWRLKEREWKYIAFAFLLLTALACCWSLAQYVIHINTINESYLHAKTIPTPLGDDHVRFSWLVCVAVITTVLIMERFYFSRRIEWIMLLIFFVVYLHVLSARTGLVMLYLFALALALYKARQKPVLSLVIVGALAVLLAIGWFFLPTFRNRIRYNLYDLSFVAKDQYVSGTSDGNRLVSVKAGWHQLKKYPWLGVGAGDVRQETNHWYDTHVAGIKETDKLYPSSEWLVYGAMAGWAGLLLFTGIIFFPLYIKNIGHRFFWIMLQLVAIAGFLVETSLEIQYGVFIYSFFVLWWWKWLENGKKITLEHD